MKPILLPVSSQRQSKATRQPLESTSGWHNRSLRAGIDFFYAEKALRAFSFLWLYWAIAKFEVLRLRPAILFSPNTLLGELTAPSLPAKETFWVIVAVAAVLTGIQLVRGGHAFMQGTVAAALLWINMVLWSYGYLTHVNHLFLLAHLFLVFASWSRKSVSTPDKNQYAIINWFYAGLLVTYTLAGLWKVGGLGYKLLTQSTDVHWLKPEAALYNALVNFRDYDLPMPFAQLYLEYAWVWQMGYVGVVYLQVSAVWAAWRPALRSWMAAFLICFHLLNHYTILVSFTVSCLVLFCLFFPYSLFSQKFKKERYLPVQNEFEGKRLKASFTCTYANGQQEIYFGFEGYRQQLLNKHYYLFGILYLPGLKTGIEFLWSVLDWLSKKEAAPPV